MSKKILPFIALGAFAFVASQQQQTTPIIPPPTNTDNTSAGGGPQLPGGAVLGIPGINRSSTPNYKTWTRKEWASWYQDYLFNTNQANAKAVVWAAWNDPLNPLASKFPSFELLELSLATWIPKGSIGQFTTTANSTPVYDTWSNWVNSVPVWQCADWVNWYDAMAGTWGQASAQAKFASAWSYSDNWSTGSNGYSCSQTCSFIQDMMNRGIDVADFGMHTVCSFTSIPYNLVKAGENVSQGVKDTAGAAATIAPLMLVGAAGLFMYGKYQENIN